MTNQSINEAVARKLMWHEAVRIENPGHIFWVSPYHADRFYPAPLDYCTDIKAAWEIVPVIQKLGDVELFGGVGPGHFSCTITTYQGTEVTLAQANADTAPMAICLAYLKLEDK